MVKLAGSHHVGHARAIDGAHQAGRNHRHLGRAATGMPHRAQRKIIEQADHAGLLQKGAKQDEQKDIAGRHIGGRAIDTLGAERQLANDLVQPVTAVRQIAGQVFTKGGVAQKRQADQRQRQAHHPAGTFEHQQQGNDTHAHVQRGHLAGTLDQVGLEHPVIKRQRKRQAGQRVTRQPAPCPALAAHVVQLEHQQQQKADVQGTHHAAGQRAERGSNDLENRKQQRGQHDAARQAALL